MLTDAEIDARCAAALPVLGPERTGWLREALWIERADQQPNPYNRRTVDEAARDGKNWPLRGFAMLTEMAALVEALRWAMGKIPEADLYNAPGYSCPHCEGLGMRPEHTPDCPWLAAKRLLERYEG